MNGERDELQEEKEERKKKTHPCENHTKRDV